MVGHARRDPEYDAIDIFTDTLAAHSKPQPPAPRTRSSVRNARARALQARRMCCNMCIATGTNVHVRFQHEQLRSGAARVKSQAASSMARAAVSALT